MWYVRLELLTSVLKINCKIFASPKFFLNQIYLNTVVPILEKKKFIILKNFIHYKLNIYFILYNKYIYLIMIKRKILAPRQ